MIQCIVIEDQPPAQRVLKRYIDDMDSIALKSTFTDPLQAMHFLKTEPIDLIFLDIHLPKISGIQFLKAISYKPHVILTTAFSDYALESYEYDVVDYLLKPFSFERFVQAVSKVPTISTEKSNGASSLESPPLSGVFFIKSGYEHIKVNVSDIRFIKSEADYTEIFTAEKKHLTSYPLHYWLEKLDQKKFAQVHKSYIINTSEISKVSGNQIFFDPETTVPLGRAYKDDFIAKYLKH